MATLSNRVFKEIPTPDGKKQYREGKRGSGVTLRHSCGFCHARMRSRRERNRHTQMCKE